jgi:hypothetical protein
MKKILLIIISFIIIVLFFGFYQLQKFELFDNIPMEIDFKETMPVYNSNYCLAFNYIKSDATIESYVDIFLIKDNSREIKLFKSFERYNKIIYKSIDDFKLKLILADTIREKNTDTLIFDLPKNI